MTIVEFLLAQLDAETERVDTIPDWFCTDSARGEGWGGRGGCPLCGKYMFEGTESVTKDAFWEHLEDVHHRTFVLAQVAAHRAIVELHAPLLGDEEPASSLDEDGWVRVSWATLRALASVYAGRDGWQEVWALD